MYLIVLIAIVLILLAFTESRTEAFSTLPRIEDETRRQNYIGGIYDFTGHLEYAEVPVVPP